MKTYKHIGNHITINTLAELEKAKKVSVKFVNEKKIIFWRNKNVFITGIAGFVWFKFSKRFG